MFVFPMTYSVDSIARRFENITAVEIAGIKADFLWDSERLIAIVIDQHIATDGRRKVLASLEMESTKWFGEDALAVEKYWEQEPSQVRGVVVIDNLREFGLATYMYETLILKKGLIIVSDNEQYAGGKALWQHIAKESKKLTIFVFDSEPKLFYPYEEEMRLSYNGSNIPETVIWSIDPDDEKHSVVLIAVPTTKE
ncbi:hypothetical protein JI57_04510 [Psychromonas sp. PRT-SC03]|nr:hypothetical protein JI57_04510 [Psychromonas sp. PRT-SC03]